ncbi:MAG: hypothetical protein ACXVY5_08310 [Gaiellales bacterium]
MSEWFSQPAMDLDLTAPDRRTVTDRDVTAAAAAAVDAAEAALEAAEKLVSLRVGAVDDGATMRRATADLTRAVSGLHWAHGRLLFG